MLAISWVLYMRAISCVQASRTGRRNFMAPTVGPTEWKGLKPIVKHYVWIICMFFIMFWAFTKVDVHIFILWLSQVSNTDNMTIGIIDFLECRF